MSTIAAEARLASRAMARAHSSVRRRRYLSAAGTAVLSFVIIVWSLAPIYNMVAVSLESHGDVFSENLFPPKPSLDSFRIVLIAAPPRSGACASR